MMNRRVFLQSIVGVFITSNAFAATKKFVFKIRTKSDSIIGNILIEASDVFGAISKLKRRYPGCEVLQVKER